MTNTRDHENGESGAVPPKTTADFGGRRKIFERRIKQKKINHPERRKGQDRRSGFDRRSTSEDLSENNRGDFNP